jgi:hypothetical protein
MLELGWVQTLLDYDLYGMARATRAFGKPKNDSSLLASNLPRKIFSHPNKSHITNQTKHHKQLTYLSTSTGRTNLCVSHKSYSQSLTTNHLTMLSKRTVGAINPKQQTRE